MSKSGVVKLCDFGFARTLGLYSYIEIFLIVPLKYF